MCYDFLQSRGAFCVLLIQLLSQASGCEDHQVLSWLHWKKAMKQDFVACNVALTQLIKQYIKQGIGNRLQLRWPSGMERLSLEL